VSVEVKNVTKKFGSFTALDNVSLKVESGELIALLGPSGSGKTTLLRTIAGLEFPDPGDAQVLFYGEDVTQIPASERKAGFAFQHYALFRHLSVFENIAFGLRQEGMERRRRDARVGDMLALVQMRDFARRRPHELSGGQKQRSAIARAVVRDPRILILDDSLSAVDTQTEEKILSRLRGVMHGRTTILIAHRTSTVREADQIVVLKDGELIERGTHDELLARQGYYADLYQKQLLEEELERA